MIVSVVVGGLLVTALVVFTMPPTYSAMSTIMIERQTPQVLDMKELMSDTSGNEHDYYYTQYEILKSRTLASQVIRDLGLQNTPLIAVNVKDPGIIRAIWINIRSLTLRLTARPSTRASDSFEINGVDPKLIDNYLKHLTITPETFTRLVKVEFSTVDPTLSARIANAHVAAYIRRGLELRAQSSEQAQRFLEAKLVELRDRVEKSEAALNSYRHDRGIIGFSVDDKDRIILQRMEDLSKALTEASTERISLEAQVQSIKHGAYDSVPEVVGSALIQRLKEDYSKLESQYAGTAEQFTSDYPPLAELGARRDQVQDRLREEINNVAASIKTRYRASLAKEKKLQAEVAEEKERTMALHDASLQDGILAREVNTNRELYKNVLERMKQIGVAAQIRASNVSVVDEAETPEYPSSPEKLLWLALAGSIAMIAAFGLAFFRDYLDDTFRSSEELNSYLHLPTLGIVPDFAKLRNRVGYGTYDAPRVTAMNGNGNGNGKVHASHSNGIGKAKSGGEIVVSGNPFSASSEAFRGIRAALLLSRAESPPKIILITSGVGGEGKTVTAVNTAAAFGQTGRSVLLIDADLRRSRCHKVLGIDNHIGLTEALTGLRSWEELVRATEAEGVLCLTAGSTPPNPCELLGSKKMAEVLRSAAANFDHIIIDSAPLVPVTDSLVLSTAVDGVVIVTGADTPKQVVRGICDRLHQVNANILGVILNRIDVTHSGYGYSAYAYSGHYNNSEHIIDDSSQPAA